MPESVVIAKYGKFMFEEPCFTGEKGSGAIFFSGCSLRCVFCQNYEISSLCNGKQISIEKLASIFKQLEDEGCENINLVNPTHYVNQIAKAFEIYKPNIPVIYNSHGYETEQTIKKASEFVNIFLPDLKFYDSNISLKYAGAKDYFEKASKAISLMRKLKPDCFDGEIMKSGVLIRHLILPLCTDDSIKILEWINKNSPESKVSLMSQYTPYGKASEYKEINRKITKREYNKVLDRYFELGLDGYCQDRESSSEVYIPKWDY